MTFYAICMLRMAVILSLDNDRQKLLYEDQAIIYLKHFCRIKKSLNDTNTGDKRFCFGCVSAVKYYRQIACNICMAHDTMKF